MASSGPFPLEIIERIVYYLTHDWVGPDRKPPTPGIFKTWNRIAGGARYATVDRAWQHAVERETFAELHLNLRRLTDAEAILIGVPRRRMYVRTIHLDVVLSCLSPKRSHTETAEQRQRNYDTLQDTVEVCLSTLNHWTHRPPVKLCLDAFMPMKDGYHAESPPSSALPHSVKYRWMLELQDLERVLRYGPVNAVNEIDMQRNMQVGRPISGAAVCTLLARLPAARKVDINWWWDASDHDHSNKRRAFAQALGKVTHAIDTFHIAGMYPEEAFGVISQRLQHLYLYGLVVDDSIFLQYNSPPEMMSSPAHWARLETFDLNYLPITPFNEWLFHPDLRNLDGESEPTIADPVLQRWYLAAARAALEMPLLRNMRIIAEMSHYSGWHKFWYHRDAKNKVVKAIWTSNSGFMPENEVLAAWQDVARKHMDGTELVVEILQDKWAV
ncbi:hypothetical protein F4810DRAFT_710162 [Camillea tinctor]|nr:hypothetical protein F4810DRAFT_710162 [Camillea tinctor]